MTPIAWVGLGIAGAVVLGILYVIAAAIAIVGGDMRGGR